MSTLIGRPSASTYEIRLKGSIISTWVSTVSIVKTFCLPETLAALIKTQTLNAVTLDQAAICVLRLTLDVISLRKKKLQRVRCNHSLRSELGGQLSLLFSNVKVVHIGPSLLLNRHYLRTKHCFFTRFLLWNLSLQKKNHPFTCYSVNKVNQLTIHELINILRHCPHSEQSSYSACSMQGLVTAEHIQSAH